LRGKFLERKTLLKAEKNQHFTALLDLDALRQEESLPVFKSLSGCHLMANGVPGEWKSKYDYFLSLRNI